MKVLVTGAAGQLGSTFVECLASRYDVVALTRPDLPIDDRAAVERAVEAARPDAVINCAAYNDVDGAQDDAVSALRVNAMGPLALSRAAARCGAVFVHYSTDFVFDGSSDRPYVETDAPRPLGYYGLSKLLGEWFAAEVPRHYVLRVESLFGGKAARSSIDRIVSALRAGQPPRVFIDRTVSPSYVVDVAAATETLLTTGAAYGLYHCVNSGAATWLTVAEYVRALLQSGTELIPVRAEEIRLKAARPKYCALSNRKLQEAGITMPAWEDALRRYVTTLHPTTVNGRAGLQPGPDQA
jgi:dTDP-4-dehydrorhamnose reductase